MRSFFVALILLFSATVHAQAAKILIEACNSIQNQEKRLECMMAAMKSASDNVSQVERNSPSSKSSDEMQMVNDKAEKSRKKYSGLIRASTALIASIESGVTFAQYQLLVQSLVVETAVGKKESAEANEIRALNHFELAVDAFKDAEVFWKNEFQIFHNYNTGVSEKNEFVPIETVEFAFLVNKWKIPTGKTGLHGTTVVMPRGLAINTLWKAGKKEIETGESELLFKSTAQLVNESKPPVPELKFHDRPIGLTISDAQEGLVISSVYGAAITSGIEVGDILVQIDNKYVSFVNQLNPLMSTLSKDKKMLGVLIRREKLLLFKLIKFTNPT